jgi:lipoate-protein ligase A
MSRLSLLLSDSRPLFNLAVEECIFRQMDPNQRVLFLWRNANTVVIGRAQNPWKECNTRRMEEDGVTLARRSSGGGAVFHDLGNSCFTFMAGKPEYDKSISTAIVLDALTRLGVRLSPPGATICWWRLRTGRKVSGSAYRRPDRGFHHGTLLLDADLGRLANYLNPDPKKLAAKGISSVRSRCGQPLRAAAGHRSPTGERGAAGSLLQPYGERVQPEHISPEQMPDLPGLPTPSPAPARLVELRPCPAFSHQLDERFGWGGVELHLTWRKG